MKAKSFWLLSLVVVSGFLLSAKPVYSQTSYVFGQAQFATGPGPLSVIVGDFNGDGILDLAVANASGTVSILLGKLDGTFAPRVDYTAGTSPSSVVAADFNGDGKLDLAVANSNDNTISILLGNGDGTFQSHVDLPVGQHPRSIAVGDFNGDGKIDLAAANSGDNTVSILLGNGNGTFQPQVPYAAGASPFSVATGDFDKDGKLDLVVATYGAFSVSTLQGNGDGTFQAPVDHPVVSSYNPVSVVVADLNGDGIPDLAIASTQNGSSSQDYISVLLGNGDGTFQNAANYTCVRFVSSIVAADFNGDGKLDLVVGNGYADYLSVFINKGDGTFEPRTDYSAGLIPVSVAAGDFNGDGNLDLVTANSQDNNVAVLLGSGDGTFQHHSDYATGDSSQGIVAADFNGDGHVDLAIADCNSNTVSVLIGNANGTFQPRLSFAAGQCPVAITAADFNGDGKIDLAVANQTDSTVSILLGNGDGTFQARTDYAVPYSAIAIAVGDFNRDGRPDVVVLASGVGVFSILFGNGDGTFQTHTDYGTGTGIGPTALTVGDFNGDGIPDLAITGAAYLTGTLAIQLGNGDGTFTARVIIPPQSLLSSPTAVAVGDFNHDGKLDLAIAEGTYQYGRIDILLGSGDGNFQFPMQSFTTALGGAHSVVTGDFNGDGILDLAVGGSSTSILLGNDDGTFQTHMDLGAGLYALTTADFDGDGRPDLATTAGASLVSVFLNKAPAQRFSKPPSITLISPVSGAQGQTIPNFTVTGTNFDSVALLSFGGTGIIVNSYSSRTATQLVASITIAGSATISNYDVVVTNPDSQQARLAAAFQVLGIPAISISPTQIAFPPTTIQTTSAPVTVTVSNPGTAALLISDISTQDPFKITNPSPNIGNVQPGTTATFDMIFSPLAQGSVFANVTIVSNASTSPTLVPLSGTGSPPSGRKGQKKVFISWTTGQILQFVLLQETNTVDVTHVRFALANLQPAWYEVTVSTVGNPKGVPKRSFVLGPNETKTDFSTLTLSPGDSIRFTADRTTSRALEELAMDFLFRVATGSPFPVSDSDREIRFLERQDQVSAMLLQIGRDIQSDDILALINDAIAAAGSPQMLHALQAFGLTISETALVLAIVDNGVQALAFEITTLLSPPAEDLFATAQR